MCEIVYMQGEKLYKYKEEIKNIAKEIFSRNSDGIGALLNREKVIKTLSIKEFLEKLDREISKNTTEIILHARLATSGFSFENTQPLESDKFVVIHNGVFNMIDGNIVNTKSEKSDSRLFLELLEKEYEESKNEIEAIKRATGKTVGYASMFILSKDSNKLYYIRENASFEVRKINIKDDEILYAATKMKTYKNLVREKRQNVVFIKAHSFKEKEIKDNVIYLVTTAGFKKVSDFSFKKRKKKNFYQYYNYRYYYI